MNFLLIITIICSLAFIQQINTRGPKHSYSLNEWAKCGGVGFNTHFRCKRNLVCILLDPWYSQCQYVPSGDNCQARYSQCGGIDYKGNNVCCDGLICNYVTDYWSSCDLNPNP